MACRPTHSSLVTVPTREFDVGRLEGISVEYRRRETPDECRQGRVRLEDAEERLDPARTPDDLDRAEEDRLSAGAQLAADQVRRHSVELRSCRSSQLRLIACPGDLLAAGATARRIVWSSSSVLEWGAAVLTAAGRVAMPDCDGLSIAPQRRSYVNE